MPNAGRALDLLRLPLDAAVEQQLWGRAKFADTAVVRNPADAVG